MPLTLTRSILGVLVPGIVASAPWLLILLQRPEIKELYKNIELPFSVLLLVISVVVGSICEGVGSHFESRWDKEREAALDIQDNWYSYLSKSKQPEPIGFRYISRLATNLYFELSMLIATPIFVLGTGFFLGELDNCSVSISIILAAISVGYFHWQARCTHEVICTTRKELNRLLKDKASNQ